VELWGAIASIIGVLLYFAPCIIPATLLLPPGDTVVSPIEPIEEELADSTPATNAPTRPSTRPRTEAKVRLGKGTIEDSHIKAQVVNGMVQLTVKRPESRCWSVYYDDTLEGTLDVHGAMILTEPVVNGTHKLALQLGSRPGGPHYYYREIIIVSPDTASTPPSSSLGVD